MYLQKALLPCIGIFLSINLIAQDSTNIKSKSKKAPPEEYIIKKDSTKIVGNVKLTKGTVLLDDKVYEFSELMGYKDGNHYHAIIGNNIYWVWALGTIQAYSEWEHYQGATSYNAKTNTMSSSSSSTSICYLRKGNGAMMLYTTANLFDLIQDNEEAVKEFHKNYRKIKKDKIPADAFYHKLRKVLAVYNGNTVSTF